MGLEVADKGAGTGVSGDSHSLIAETEKHTQDIDNCEDVELELGNRHGGVETFRTRSRTIEDSVASVHAQLVLKSLLALRTVRILYKSKHERSRVSIVVMARYLPHARPGHYSTPSKFRFRFWMGRKCSRRQA